MAKTAAFAMLIILAATSCNKEQYWYGRKINFVAKSKGYMTKAAATKTAYAGEDETVATKLTERIDWAEGDRIYIYCSSATNKGDGTHYAEYGVEKFSAESNAVSKASIQPTDFANSMEWGTGTHDFYAMYPSPKEHATNSFTKGTMVFTMPAAYPVSPKTAVITTAGGVVNYKPDMDYAPMLAAQTGVSASASSVTLPFTPQFNAFEITIDKGSYTSISLSQFRIYGADGDKLSGTFTVTPGHYAQVETITSATNTVTLNLTGVTLNADNPTLKLTALTLPGTFTSGITIEFTGSFDGGSAQTRKLTLKTSGGDFVEFAPYKKYRIYGLSFPVLVDATIEDSISWDYGLEIMDGVIWWIGTGIENHVTWMDDIDINAYGQLPDDVKWFQGSYIVQDFSWEELDHIALNSDADMYLWRTETGQRTVTAYNRTGTIFSDVSASWSCTPRSGVIHLNETTGEVRAVAPGEATVTATVTPNDGSTPWTTSYKVYVNAPTGITLEADEDFVLPEETVGLTATLTCTSNGTITSYPADMLEWSSANESYITVSGDAQPVSGGATATATGDASEGTSTLTVSVAAKYADGISASLTDFPCEDRTFIKITAPGEKYKFRDYYMSPGILQYSANTEIGSHGYSLTDGSDPLELLQHYYYDMNPTGKGFDGTAATHFGLNVYYHSWSGTNSLYHRLHGSTDANPGPNANITETITLSGVEWRIPTGNTGGESDKIFTKKPTYSIKINGTTKTDNSYNYVRITVDLTNATKTNEAAENYNMRGLGTGYGNGPGIGDNAGSSQYQCGVLLIPDGAKVHCSMITTIPDNVFNNNHNVLQWEDLKTLTDGGCVFLPTSGIYYASSWNNGASIGRYWSATQSGDNIAYNYYFILNQVDFNSNGSKTMHYFPVKLIHD